MLRRVNAALFQAPPGARIQVVAESQGNNGVNDARFEYAREVLRRETILGLPGCSFTVAGTDERLEAGVVFDPGAPGAARYDLFEVENGVKSDLRKSTKNSDSAPLISFTIEPAEVVVAAAARAGGPRRRAAAAKRRPARHPAKSTGRKKPRKKTAARKKTTTAARKTASGRKAAGKKTARKASSVRGTAGRRQAGPARATSRKRAR
jgi:hypothetical protein